MERQAPSPDFRRARRGYDPAQVDAHLAEMAVVLGELEATVRRRGATIRVLERRLADLGGDDRGSGDDRAGDDRGNVPFNWPSARAEVRAALAEEGAGNGDLVVAETGLLTSATRRSRRSRYRHRSAHLPSLGLVEPPPLPSVFGAGRRFRFRPA